MTHFNFKKWNTILGWFAFTVALITYALTIEPTVSFWDAGEYILTSSKLQVGHPPGAPFFQMMGAFFSMFALEPSQVGMMLNMMSAVASAFTILFMFWTISLLLRKLAVASLPKKEAINDEYDTTLLSKQQNVAILGSALVGSLAFTFTDSFWFNAVETEVYAMAALIMSIMFWLGLRWEQDMNTPRGNRWLILIAFVIGMSFGVHFMGLLTIPAIGLIYYFKNYKEITVKNFIIANVVAVAILLFVFKLLAPNIMRAFSASELFFVNSIGLPFNSGSIIAGIVLIAIIYFGLKYTRQKNYKHLNTGILCLTFIIIGFSSWLMLPIRANAQVVINENNPSSARELLAYYNLEQYPETHLFYGPLFTEQYTGYDANQPFIDDKPKYEKDEKSGKYIVVNDWKNAKQNYNSEQASILPRMWSTEHAENYMMFTGLLDFKIKPEYQMENQVRALVNDFRQQVAEGRIDYEDYHLFLKRYGQEFLDIEKPSLLQNVGYMLEYQLGYMYWRYFMWNFVGRQDDIQGKYDDLHGNWISGIDFIDEMHLGMSQKNLPSDVENNKARNTYYFLPLILGLIGFLFLLSKDKKLFWTMLVFFLFTGLAIQFYTNIRPFEPRERDYSVVGSFYVFAIWIGFGVYSIFEGLKKYSSSKFLAPSITLVCLILVPGILAANNWDDHDRSDRETAHAMAIKYLQSCAPNAILFTIGDNDTFPLWYAQEIEGIRTDVRVVNTSLFQTDWYIDQMKRKAYESDPIPSQLTHDQYKFGTRDYIMRREITKDTLMIKDFMNFVSSDDPRYKLKYILQREGEDLSYYPSNLLNSNYFPTSHIRVPVDKASVLEHGIVKPKDADKILPYLDVEIKGGALYKNRLLMLDIVANNNWERPIYFTGGAFGDDDYIWMKDYLQLDGLCYKLVPIKTPVDRANPFDMGRVDSELMYEKVMAWDWGNSGNENVYHDTESRKNGITYRGNLARLVEQLINEEEYDKAEKVADLAMEKMPVDIFGYYTLLEPYISAYYEVDKVEKGRDLFKKVSKKYQESLTYYSGLSIENQTRYLDEIVTDIERYRALVDILVIYKDGDFALEETERFNNYLKLFNHFAGDEPEDDEQPLMDDLDIISNDSVDSLFNME
ncbi:protein O-mannosyl-transferase family [Gaetbulibacter sp. PBL-D1]|uniref:protein O-mannosyl-transferase family n=1 Tax=Gaetbulibacter sp. PBL-D1 TaxID=3422594 RepID=UPI003D2F38A1